MRGPRWWARVVVFSLPLWWACLLWGSEAGVRVVGKVKAVTVLEYGGRLYEEGVPVTVFLRPDVDSSFDGEIHLRVMSNTPWRLYVSVKGIRVGGEEKEVVPKGIVLRVGERRVAVGAKKTLLITGDRGVCPLDCELSVTFPPEVGGSGEVELVLNFSAVGALP